MRSILRRREVVADDWRYRSESVSNPGLPSADEAQACARDVNVSEADGSGTSAADAPAREGESLIVAAAEFRAQREFWLGRGGRLGVRLSPADNVEELRPDIDRISLVAVEFPGPGDGRGFSQARLLRQRLHFRGELRAVGAGVKQDLIFLMARCGFDSFELAPGQSAAAALAAYERYTVAYQPGAPLDSIRAQRFFSATP